MSEKTLVIAEKPSVAGDIIKVLPDKFTRHKTHYEGERYLVSFAIGHLVGIAYPEEIDPRYQKWDISLLPILPETFPLAALSETKAQLTALGRLMQRKDVTEIINACDAGREGELIFKYILRFVDKGKEGRKRVRRLWLQSMTRDAIRAGFAQLRENSSMQSLEDTALCRSEADWLIGINATRALTGYNSRNGGFRKTPCGRVQTPTLSLIVTREHERLAFVPAEYWELHATFAVNAAQGQKKRPGGGGEGGGQDYQGVWIDPAFKASAQVPQGKANRLWDEVRARDIVARCSGRPATVTQQSKKGQQGPPPLYDLTSLQREANSRFGFSAKNTLSIAQALYERHKLLTYPRTDSRHLPEDYVAEARDIMGQQRGWQLGAFAAEALDKEYIKKNKRIFDNAKVSDHFAIIPTGVLPKTLSVSEEKIYRMVVQRFIATFFPPAQFLQTTRHSLVEGETFLTEGRIWLVSGWKAVYGGEADDEGERRLAELAPDTAVLCREIESRHQVTKPQPRYTEATLLSAMEHSDKLLDDEGLREAMKDRGLGTPATRAAIIEKLLSEKYIVREGKDLAPTGKAFELIALLSGMGIEVLASPELTGEWEFKLNQILKGGLSRTEFMREIRDLTRRVVEQVQGYEAKSEGAATAREASFSPLDGRRYYETATGYHAEGSKRILRKVLGGRPLREEEIVVLLQGGTIGPFHDFRSKQGRPFSASLKLTEGKVEFIFDQAGGEEMVAQETLGEPLGLSPVDQSPVYDRPQAYMSVSALAGDRDKGLRIGKTILAKAIEPRWVTQLLRDGRTELIKGCISKSRRPFDAHLTLDDKGKLGFDFPPRPVRKGRVKREG